MVEDLIKMYESSIGGRVMDIEEIENNEYYKRLDNIERKINNYLEKSKEEVSRIISNIKKGYKGGCMKCENFYLRRGGNKTPKMSKQDCKNIIKQYNKNNKKKIKGYGKMRKDELIKVLILNNLI